MTGAPGPRDWGMLGLLGLFFGGAFAAIEVAIETIPPATVVAARLWLATGLLYLLARARGHHMPPIGDGRHIISLRWKYFVLLSVVGNILPFTLIAWGQLEIESGLSGILTGTMPLITLGLAAALVPSERITAAKFIGFALGFAGLVTLIGPSALGLAARQSLIHQLAVLTGAFCYAANTILTKRMPETPALAAGTAISLCGAVLALPVALIADAPWTLSPSAASLAGVAMLAVFPTALAAWILIALVRSAGPTFMSQANYLTPVCAVIVGAALLGERPGLTTYVGLALILAGIAVSQTRRRRRSNDDSPTEVKDAPPV